MSVFEVAIGWLAPPDCIGCGAEGSTFCEGCGATEILPFGEHCYQCNRLSYNGRTCPACRPSSPSHVWITTDYEGLAKELVQKLKFSHQRAAAEPLADLMRETLLKFMDSDELKVKNYLILPVPSATKRVRQRGFDHTALLADKLAAGLGLESKNLLKRLGQSRQVGAKRDVRKKQAEGNYILPRPEIIHGRRVILIDDVITTGATLRAATKVLRTAGAKSVDALVFAKKL